MFENSPAFCPTMLPSLQYTVIKLSEMFKLMVGTSCSRAIFSPTPVNSQTVSYFWHTKTRSNCQRSKLQTSYYQHCGHQTVRPQTTRQRDLVSIKDISELREYIITNMEQTQATHWHQSRSGMHIEARARALGENFLHRWWLFRQIKCEKTSRHYVSVCLTAEWEIQRSNSTMGKILCLPQ